MAQSWSNFSTHVAKEVRVFVKSRTPNCEHTQWMHPNPEKQLHILLC